MAQLQEAFDTFAAAIDAIQMRSDQRSRKNVLGGGLDRERRAVGREYSAQVRRILGLDGPTDQWMIYPPRAETGENHDGQVKDV